MNKLGKYLTIFIIIFLSQASYATTIRKTIQASRIDKAPVIDGLLNDDAWKNAAIATDFVQVEPYNGAPSCQKSEIKFLYDDDAIYIGAMLYDNAPDSMISELSKRDEQGNAEFFGVHIDPFNDAKTTYGFFVNPAGVQTDSKVPTTGDHDDSSWDAVWESSTRMVDNGWIVEMRIPYSALRFPKKDVQSWGINFFREIKRFREKSSWNFVDKEISGTPTQSGLVEGIKNIKPPLRLSAVPYISGYIENNGEHVGWGKTYGYGMDIKYGINESFTLDMTLIPDFSQVQSDDKIVNLSPFETFYQERRPFFTEGTELFNRDDRIFYSRRIGTKPINYNKVYNEYDKSEVISNPETTQLINATKISGKTRSGLGLGIFNAMTSNTYAKVKNESGNEEQYLTQPFTNYNMIVIDQSLKNNSFVTFYNTNVNRGKSEYMANVSGSQVRFVDKNNFYAVSGQFNLSQKYYPHQDNVFGHSYQLSIGKISGKFKYSYSHSAMSDTYDHNDMGYLSHNNIIDHTINISYSEYQPFWKLLNLSNSIGLEYSAQFKPREFSTFQISTNTHATTRGFASVGINTKFEPKGSDDHFEARVNGWTYKMPASHFFSVFISPDYRKKYVTDIRLQYTGTTEKGRNSILFSLGQRIRLSDKFNMIITTQYNKDNKSYGYVTDSLTLTNDRAIIFGQRDVQTITNTIESNYIFTNKASLSLRLRHYWIKALYNDYFNLNHDGTLSPNEYVADKDFNVNTFNIDMVYTWNFAPGSEILLVYKNAVYADVNSSVKTFFDNLKYTFDSPMVNSFSLKILYYLDYQYLKKKSKRN